MLFRLRSRGYGCLPAFLILLAGLASATPQGDAPDTYYVDSEAGQDDADGRSAQQAWRSLDRVNSAELKPGDTVRFQCGGVWRGTLEPVSGDDSAPVTYTSYGEGPKPLLLGSVPRDLPEDWVKARDTVWATLPMEYSQGEQILDLRQSAWRQHQEAGATVKLNTENKDEGRTVRFTCGNSGTARNHVQVWGPSLPVKKGASLAMTFRARSTKPFAMPTMSLRQAGSPWTAYAQSNLGRETVGPEWCDFKATFSASGTSEAACIHMFLGSVLPEGAVFEFKPLAVHAVEANIPDPLSVDVGNIIFDHGKTCGWKKWSAEDLKKPYDYYYEGTTSRVYLYSPANPATRHKSIECALKRHIVNQGNVHHITYDGLAGKYGAAHGFGGGWTHHLIIRNCDLAYIGGGHQLTRPSGTPVRYGNAIEFWGAAHDNLVEGCRIWEVYDAALTNQSKGENVHQENITYRNNIIWNCEYSFEYWSSPESAVTKNIRFVNNTCVNAGTVWSHAQRPDRNGSHLMFYGNRAALFDFEVKYNVFCGVTDWGSRYTSGWDTLPDMDHNLWFSDRGVMAYFFKDKIKAFEDYQKASGLDQHSVFADPQFVDASNRDYRLAPTSPARTIRPGGAPIGAESLWE